MDLAKRPRPGTRNRYGPASVASPFTAFHRQALLYFFL